ncbi:putative cyclase-domain-containing protein [Lophiotrema nucula]|uniref:Putative cyclase-domain-containing protein n=1 Tax=Lophiotrema nucula TaxID=690887 RepID=A0A6A5YXE6_9PLEO|nr:putative cyclase-domain-containing protein [Lophiotrema nucula]
MTSKPLPRFEDLPLRQGDPPFSAWGLWENPHLGALNYLTDKTVLQAAKEEIQTGERVGLNLPLDFINPPLLGRVAFSKKMHNKAPRTVNDDIISFNTQCSAQWDSFRHFGYQQEKVFYNGVTQDDIHRADDTTVNGIDGWEDRGIAGRGVLVDYYAWAQKNGIAYDATQTHPIKVDDVKSIIAENNIKLRPGDILFIRTGFVDSYAKMDAKAREFYKDGHSWPGLAQSKETLKWLWEQQFAAVAADNPAFEVFPAVEPEYLCHPVLLSGWATPIGELFDLERLAEICARKNRWTFFVSSAPLNYKGVVASPPNVIAFF